jgi:hypothetical protein
VVSRRYRANSPSVIEAALALAWEAWGYIGFDQWLLPKLGTLIGEGRGRLSVTESSRRWSPGPNPNSFHEAVEYPAGDAFNDDGKTLAARSTNWSTAWLVDQRLPRYVSSPLRF